MFYLLKQKMDSLSEADRVCSLVLDEMDLHEKTQYSSQWKRIIPKASKALVIMVIFINEFYDYSGAIVSKC